jgi:hypothetical protein
VKWWRVAPIVVGFLGFASPVRASDFEGWQVTEGTIQVGEGVRFSFMTGRFRLTVEPPVNAEFVRFSIRIENTVSNTIGWGAPTPDWWSVSISSGVDTMTVEGNEIGIFEPVVEVPVSGSVTVEVAGRDVGFWAGFYGPLALDPVLEWVLLPETTVLVSTTILEPSPTNPVSTTSEIVPSEPETTLDTTVPESSSSVPSTTEEVPSSDPIDPNTTTTNTDSPTTALETTVPPIAPISVVSSTTSTTTTTLPPTTIPETTIPPTTTIPPETIPETTIPPETILPPTIPVPNNSASDETKRTFEEQVNVFDGSYDSYVPAGSTITVGQRRTLVAVQGSLLTSAVATRRRPK